MTPGLAFFEAGLLRSRNSISILMQCWAGLCILSTLWCVSHSPVTAIRADGAFRCGRYIIGYTLALGPDVGGEPRPGRGVQDGLQVRGGEDRRGSDDSSRAGRGIDVAAATSRPRDAVR